MSNLSVIALLFFNNYVFYNYYIIPTYYAKYGISSSYLYLAGCILSLITYLLLPKVIPSSLCCKIKKTKLSKIILSIYFYLTSFFTLLMASLALGYNFYQNYQPLLFAVAFIIMAFIFLKYHQKYLVNSALVFFFILAVFIFYAFFSHYSYIDLSEIYLLKPSFKIFLSIYIIFFLIFDNYNLMIMFRRKNRNLFLISNIIFFTVSFLEMVSLSLLFNNSLQGFGGFGFLLYNLKPNFFVLENFDFLYIFAITLTTIVKLGLNLNIIKSINFKSPRFMLIMLFIILFLTSYFGLTYWYLIKPFLEVIMILLTILSGLVFIILRRNSYEVNRTIKNNTKE